MLFAQLGQHVFEGIKAPGTLNESFGVRYGQITLIEGKDAIQYTGEELDEISINMLYSSEFCTPREEIDALKTSARAREVLPFIFGDGTILGNFVITNIEVTGERYSPSGTLETARVYVTLLEDAHSEQPATVGSALASQNPTAQTPAAPVPSPANSIAEDIAEGNAKAATISETTENAAKSGASLKKAVRDVRKLSNDAIQLYSSAKTKVENTQKIIERAADLPTSLEEAIRYAENLARLEDTADLTVLQMNAEGLSKSVEKVKSHTAPVVAFSATKEGGN